MRRWLLVVYVMAMLVAALFAPGAHALDGPRMLVATEKLEGSAFWARAVIFVIPFRDGHLGVVLNKPAPVTMAQLFPDFKPAKRMPGEGQMFFGGPSGRQAIVGLVGSIEPPGPGSVQMLKDVWLIVQAEVIDAMIEREPGNGRYFLGFTHWPPGALEDEIARQLLEVRGANADLILSDPASLYDRLMPNDDGRPRPRI